MTIVSPDVSASPGGGGGGSGEDAAELLFEHVPQDLPLACEGSTLQLVRQHARNMQKSFK